MVDAVAAPVVARPGLEEEVRALSKRLEEPGELKRRRLEAWEVWRGLPAPERVQHLWRYTDPAWLVPAAGALPGGPRLAEDLPPMPEGGGVVLAEPGVAPQWVLSQAAREAGVEVTPLTRAEWAWEWLGGTVPPSHGLLEALNAAAWSTGVAVRIPRGAAVPGPILVSVPASGGLSATRVLVLAGEGSQATLVEEHRGGTEGVTANAVTEIVALAGARLRHVLVQRWDQGVHGSHTLRAEVGRDADLLTVLAAQGGGVVKADLGATLTGHGAHSELVGVLLADGDQHLDHHTLHDHRAPHTWSNINLKVALSGHARSAYTGLIRIDPAAPGSEAYQENRNLLLSDHCRADTIPELEILTDDVVCTHGATVAPIDREQVFYLESRGLPTVGAQRLIVRGFVQGALERVPEGLRAGVEEQVERRLAALGAAQRRPA